MQLEEKTAKTFNNAKFRQKVEVKMDRNNFNDFSHSTNSSPTYQLSQKSKKGKDKNYLKEAPLVDPEPTSDISNFNAPAYAQNSNNGNLGSDATKSNAKEQQSTTHGN